MLPSFGSIQRNCITLMTSVYDAYMTFSKKHNENHALNETLARAVLGLAEPVETYRYVVDPERLRLKTVHVVTDKKTMIEVFHKGRNGDHFSFALNETLGSALGKDNLLLCPMAAHRDLRSPVEKSFKQNEILKSFDQQVERLLDLLGNKKYHETCVDEFVMETLLKDVFGIPLPKNDQLIKSISYLVAQGSYSLDNEIEEILKIDRATLDESKAFNQLLKLESSEKTKSTIRTLLNAGFVTTTTLIHLFHGILLLNPGTRDKIQLEWKQFLEVNNLDVSDQKSLLQAFNLFVNGGILAGKKVSPSVWLHASYREASRLFPSVPTIARVANQSMQLGGKTISKGDLVDVDIFAANRNARVWEQPEVFMPERFIDSDGNLKRENELINFGQGAQSCIGQHLAKQEALIYVGLMTVLYDRVVTGDSENGNITVVCDVSRVDLMIENRSGLECLEAVLTMNAHFPESQKTFQLSEKQLDRIKEKNAEWYRLSESANATIIKLLSRIQSREEIELSDGLTWGAHAYLGLRQISGYCHKAI